MTARGAKRALAAIVLAGAIARVVAWRLAGGMHPDEFYQALEPAWSRLNGVGMTSWEWRDGVRSWVLPGYNGAWMALLRAFGVRRGDAIGSIIQLHWALVSLVLVIAAYRGGASVARTLARTPTSARGEPRDQAGWQGGLLAAASCALFPTLVAFSTHTLSELPSMLCIVFAIALSVEAAERDAPPRSRALVIGALLALGVCIRIVNAPLTLVVPIGALVRRRFAFTGWLALGAAFPIVVFGLVDLVTWGRFLGSYIGYLDFNLIHGKASVFGKSPASWYAEDLWRRAPVALALLAVPAFAGLRATWPFVAPAFALVLALSTQAHKEERFIIAFWPLLLIAAAGALGAAVASVRQRTRLVATASALAIVACSLDALARLGGGENTFARGRLEAQIAAGRDASAGGLVIDNTFYSGGAMWFGREVPQLEFDSALLQNPLVTHALVVEGSDDDRAAREAGFDPVLARDGMVLLRRRGAERASP